MEEQDLSEQQAVLPAQCGHLQALHTLRLDCFSEMKTFPLQVSLPNPQGTPVMSFPGHFALCLSGVCLALWQLFDGMCML